MIAAAALMSDTSHATIGLLPPSSSARILCGISANCRASAAPAPRRAGEQQAVDPRLGGERLALADPADQQRMTPSGTPASWKHSTSIAPVAGVFSDGLNTTALPAISAGTMWPLGKCAGKL